MATARRNKRRTSQRQNMQSFSGSAINLTGDSPVNQLAPSQNTGQSSANDSVILLNDSIDLSSPAKQARLEDRAEKKSSKKKSRKKELSCPVCLQKLEFGNPAPEKQVMSTQCGHIYCYSCIVTIVNNRQECPVCRKKQTIQDIHPLYV